MMMSLYRETEHACSETDNRFRDPDYMKSKLQQIVDVYGSLHSTQRDCLKSIPIWLRKRRESIEQLESLAFQIKERKKNCDVVKFAGEAVSLIGGAISMFGAILDEHESSDTSRTMMKKGRAGGLFGGAISCGASTFGSLIDNEDSKKVKEILQRDEEESATLLKFRNTTEEFKDHVEEIMKFDVFERVVEGFVTLKQGARCSKKSKKFQRALPFDVFEMIKYLPLPAAAKSNVEEFMRILCSSHECWNLFKLLSNIKRDDPLVFQAAFLIGKLSLKGLHTLQNPISSISLTILKNAIAPSEGNNSIVGQGFFSTASVAMDLMNIVDTSKEIAEETPSELLKYLQRVIKMMREESKIWREIYHIQFHQNMY